MAERSHKTHRLPIVVAVLVVALTLVFYWDTVFPSKNRLRRSRAPTTMVSSSLWSGIQGKTR